MSHRFRGVTTIPAEIKSTFAHPSDDVSHYKSSCSYPRSSSQRSSKIIRHPSQETLFTNSTNNNSALPPSGKQQIMKSVAPDIATVSSPAASTNGIVVMLFHERQLLYRYPPEDPFVISHVDGVSGAVATGSTTHDTTGTNADGPRVSTSSLNFMNSIFVGATFSPPDGENTVIKDPTCSLGTNESIFASDGACPIGVVANQCIPNDKVVSQVNPPATGVQHLGAKELPVVNNDNGCDSDNTLSSFDSSLTSNDTTSSYGTSSSVESSTYSSSMSDNTHSPICGSLPTNCILNGERDSDEFNIRLKEQQISVIGESAEHFKYQSLKRKKKGSVRKPRFYRHLASSVKNAYNPNISSSDTFSSLGSEDKKNGIIVSRGPSLVNVSSETHTDTSENDKSTNRKQRQPLGNSFTLTSSNIFESFSVSVDTNNEVITDQLESNNEQLISEKQVLPSINLDVEVPQTPAKIVFNPAERRARRGNILKPHPSVVRGTDTDTITIKSNCIVHHENITSSVKDGGVCDTRSPFHINVTNDGDLLQSLSFLSKSTSKCELENGEKNEQVPKVVTDVNQIGSSSETSHILPQTKKCGLPSIPTPRPSISIAKWLSTTSTACLGLPESCWSYIFQSDINGTEPETVRTTPSHIRTTPLSTFPNNSTGSFPTWKKNEDHEEDDTEENKEERTTSVTDGIMNGIENGVQSSRCLMVKICRAQMLIFPVGMINFGLLENLKGQFQTRLKREPQNPTHNNSRRASYARTFSGFPVDQLSRSNKEIIDEGVNTVSQHGGTEVLSVLFDHDKAYNISETPNEVKSSKRSARTKKQVYQHQYGTSHIVPCVGTDVLGMKKCLSTSCSDVLPSDNSDASLNGSSKVPPSLVCSDISGLGAKETRYHSPSPESSNAVTLDDVLAFLYAYHQDSDVVGGDEEVKSMSIGGRVNNLLQRSSLHIVVAIDEEVLSNFSEPHTSSHDNNPTVIEVHSIMKRFVAALEREERTEAYLTQEVTVLVRALHNLREKHIISGPNMHERNMLVFESSSSKHVDSPNVFISEDMVSQPSSSASPMSSSPSVSPSNPGSAVSRTVANYPLSPSTDLVSMQNEGLFSFIHRATQSSLCDALCSLAKVVVECVTLNVNTTRSLDNTVSRGISGCKQIDIIGKSSINSHPCSHSGTLPQSRNEKEHHTTNKSDGTLTVNSKLTFSSPASSFRGSDGRVDVHRTVMNLIAYMHGLPCSNRHSTNGKDQHISEVTLEKQTNLSASCNITSWNTCDNYMYNYGYDDMHKYAPIARDCLGELERLLRSNCNNNRTSNSFSSSKKSTKAGGENSETKDNYILQHPSQIRDELLFVISGPNKCPDLQRDENEGKSQDSSVGQFIKKSGVLTSSSSTFDPFIIACIEETSLFSTLKPIYNAAACCMAQRLEKERDIMTGNIRQQKDQKRYYTNNTTPYPSTSYPQNRFVFSKFYSPNEQLISQKCAITSATLTPSLVTSPLEMMCHLLPIYTVCGRIFGMIPPVKVNDPEVLSYQTELPCRSIGGLRRVLYNVIRSRFLDIQSNGLDIETDEVIVQSSSTQETPNFYNRTNSNTVSSSTSGTSSSGGSNASLLQHNVGMSLYSSSSKTGLNRALHHMGAHDNFTLSPIVGPRSISLEGYHNTSNTRLSPIGSAFRPLTKEQREKAMESSVALFIHLLRMLGLLVLFEPAVILLNNGGVCDQQLNRHCFQNVVLDRDFLLVTPLHSLMYDSSVLPPTELQKYKKRSYSTSSVSEGKCRYYRRANGSLVLDGNSVNSNSYLVIDSAETVISCDSGANNSNSDLTPKVTNLMSIDSTQLKRNLIDRLINVTNVHYYNLLPIGEVDYHYSYGTQTSSSLTCLFGEGCIMCRALAAAVFQSLRHTTQTMSSICPLKNHKYLPGFDVAGDMSLSTSTTEDKEHRPSDQCFVFHVPCFDDPLSKELYMRSVQRSRVVSTWYIPPPLLSIYDNNFTLSYSLLTVDSQGRQSNKNRSTGSGSSISPTLGGHGLAAEGCSIFPIPSDPYIALFERSWSRKLLYDKGFLSDKAHDSVGVNILNGQERVKPGSFEAFYKLLAVSLKASKQHLLKEWNGINDRVYSSFGVRNTVMPFIYKDVETFSSFCGKRRKRPTFDNNETMNLQNEGKQKCRQRTDECVSQTDLSQSLYGHNASHLFGHTTVSNSTALSSYPVTDLLLFLPSNSYASCTSVPPLSSIGPSVDVSGHSEDIYPQSSSCDMSSLPLPYPALLVTITNIMIFLFWHRHVDAVATITNLTASGIVRQSTTTVSKNDSNVRDQCNKDNNNVSNNSDNQIKQPLSSSIGNISTLSFTTVSVKDEPQSTENCMTSMETSITTAVEYIPPICPHSLSELALHVSHHLARVDKALEKMKVVVSFVNYIVKEEIQHLFQHFVVGGHNMSTLHSQTITEPFNFSLIDDVDKLGENLKVNSQQQKKRALRERRTSFVSNLITAASEALSFPLKRVFIAASSIFVSSSHKINSHISANSEKMGSFQKSVSDQTFADAISTTLNEGEDSASKESDTHRFMFSLKTDDNARIAEKFQKVTVEIASIILEDLLDGRYCSHTYMGVEIGKWKDRGRDNRDAAYPTLPLLLNREDIRRAIVIGLCRELLDVNLCDLTNASQFLEGSHSDSGTQTLAQPQVPSEMAHQTQMETTDTNENDVVLNNTRRTGLISVVEVLKMTYRFVYIKLSVDGVNQGHSYKKYMPTFSQKEILRAGHQLLNVLARIEDDTPTVLGRETSVNRKGEDGVYIPSDDVDRKASGSEYKVIRSQEVSWDDQKTDMVVLLQIYNILSKIEERRVKTPDRFPHSRASHEAVISREEQELTFDYRLRRSYSFSIDKLGFACAGDTCCGGVEIEGTVLPPIMYARHVLGLPLDWLRHFCGCKVRCCMFRSERGRLIESSCIETNERKCFPKKFFSEDSIFTPQTANTSGSSEERLSKESISSFPNDTHQETLQAQRDNSHLNDIMFEKANGVNMDRQLEVTIHHVLHLFPEVFQTVYTQI